MNPRPTTLSAIGSVLVVLVSCAPAERGETSASGAPVPTHEISGPALPMAYPEDVGLSAESLGRIRPAMQALVDDGRLPGVVTMVARRGHIVHWEAVGMRDIEAGDPLEPDDIFRIYSMTKPITSAAIMMLVEGGEMALEDPVSRFIPAFADLKVYEGEGGWVPVARPLTIKHLLSHSGGLTYGFFRDTPVDRMYLAEGVFASPTLEDFVAGVTALPLAAHPGEQWIYSVSTDILGHLVEVVSGRPFELFLEERIFEPLGMDDTGFFVPIGERDRFAAHYDLSDEGLRKADPKLWGSFAEMPTLVSGGSGLVSTASDYVRFAQMLLGEGVLDGVRILRRESVAAMTRNQLPPKLTPIEFENWMPSGYGFGLGFAILVDEDATPEADHNGIFRWGGLANTFFWIDPEAELIAMVWTQVNPFLIHAVEKQFQPLVYDAIEDPSP